VAPRYAECLTLCSTETGCEKEKEVLKIIKCERCGTHGWGEWLLRACRSVATAEQGVPTLQKYMNHRKSLSV
jgi:hypothetical protein